MRKIDNLTGLRAFASLWVVLVHFSSNTGVAEFLAFARFIQNGSFGVDVFFVLSGLVITLNYLPALLGERPFGPRFVEYIAKRFARLYPLHLMTFLMTVGIVGIAMWRHYHFRDVVTYSGYTAVLNLLMMHAWALTDKLSWNGVSWSISAEWFAYLLVFPCCAYLLQRLSLLWATLCVAVCWLIFTGIVILGLHQSIMDFTYNGIFRIIPEFMAGYVVYRYRDSAPACGDCLTLAGVAAVGWVATVSGLYEPLMLPAVAVLLLGLYRGGPITDAVFGNPLSVFLGETSFALYMVHPFIKTFGDQVMRTKVSWATPSHAIPLLVAEVIAAQLLAAAAYFVVERPARRRVMKLFYRTVAVPRDARATRATTV